MQVGGLARRIGLREHAELARRHGERPAPEQQVFRRHRQPAPQAVGPLVEGHDVGDPVDQAQLQMVLQIAADAGQVVPHGHPLVLQQRARPDAGDLEQVRRADRAGGENQFAGDIDPRLHALAPELEPACPPAVEQDAFRLGVGEDRQVGPVARRFQEGLRRVPARAPALVDHELAGALVVAVVEVRRPCDADLVAGALEGVEDFPADPRLLDPPFAAGAVEGVGRAEMVLGLPEQGQHVVPGPAAVAHLGPAVIVPRLAAHVDHAVDRGAAAEHPAARIVERPAVQPVLGFGLQAPVGARIALGVEIADRHLDPEIVVLAAGLEQQDAVAPVFRQPVGKHAAGRAGADDDIVEAAQ